MPSLTWRWSCSDSGSPFYRSMPRTKRELAGEIREHEGLCRHKGGILRVEVEVIAGSSNDDDNDALFEALAATLKSGGTTMNLTLWGDFIRGDDRGIFDSVVDFVRALKPRDIFVYGEYDFGAIVAASASSSFYHPRGVPTAYFPLFDSPTYLYIRGDGDFLSCTHFQRLLRTSVIYLHVEHGNRDMSMQTFTGLLGLCKSSECRLLELTANIPLLPLQLAIAKRSLCDTGHFIRVRYGHGDVITEEEWNAAQEIKRHFRVFVSSASTLNALSSPHVFAKNCGRDVQRKIFSYLL